MNNIMDILKKPLVMIALSVVVGIFLGVTYGYVINPVRWVNQDMTMTRPDLQESYMRMVLDSLRINGDVDLALARYRELGDKGPGAFDAVKTNPGDTDPGVIAQFDQALQNAGGGQATPTPGGGGDEGSPFTTIIIVVIVIVLLGVLGAILFWLFRSNHRAPEDMTPAQRAAEVTRAVEKTDYSTTSATPPVAQYVTTYMLGDDLFDDSFSIDAPSGEFLGECGVGISETVGVGDPKKVAAFEVWMFDKNDIQTVTKVLMSARAFSDPAFRAKLEPKGELVQLDPHKQVLLETQTLQMIATVSDMQYGQGALPDGSYFDRVTLELAIWSKK